MDKIKKDKASRILILLKMFNDGKKVTFSLLEGHWAWSEVGTKTMERDINSAFEFLENNNIKTIKQKQSNGYMEYSVANKLLFENLWDKDSIRIFSLLYSIIHDNKNFNEAFKFNETDKKTFEKISDDINTSYLFLNRPIEKLENTNLLNQLERAIKNRQKISVKYNKNDVTYERILLPYYIVFMNENFYLVCYFPEEERDEKIRIQEIEELKILRQGFRRDPNLEKFFQNMQGPFAKYKRSISVQPTKIILKVDKDVKKYFEAKKYFNSQRILNEESSDGSIKVEYKVTQDLELLYFILQWSSGVEVLEPLTLRNKVKEILQKALSKYE